VYLCRRIVDRAIVLASIALNLAACPGLMPAIRDLVKRQWPWSTLMHPPPL